MRPSPYKGLVPFTEGDGRLFFGRDGECRLVIANLFAAQLTILFGPSGVGKSSLLRAGVARKLHSQPGRAAVVFDGWRVADPVLALKRAVADELKAVAPDFTTDESQPLEVFLARCSRAVRAPLVIVLDQFEEYLLDRASSAGDRGFDASFARAVNHARSRIGRHDAGSGRLHDQDDDEDEDVDVEVSFLVSIREDALGRLDRYEDRIPSLFGNYLRLEDLDHRAGREAIVGPIEVYNREAAAEAGVHIEPNLIEALLEQVTAGRVSITESQLPQFEAGVGAEAHILAPYLQLVLARLWEEEARRDSRTLRESTLKSLGGAQEIARTHLDIVMAALTSRQQAVAARMFRFLAMPSGRKVVLTSLDLASLVELPVTDVDRVARRLADPDIRLLRPVAAGSPDQSVSAYEIFHDVLAPAVLDWRTRYFARSALSRRLLSCAALTLIGSVAVQVAFTLPASILLVLRAISLTAFDAIALMQLYRWFSRYIMSTTSSLLIGAFRGPDLGVILGALLTMLWFATTSWGTNAESDDSLGSIDLGTYLQYQVIVAMLTLFVGFVAFITMWNAGLITARLFHRFELGFYGAYALACVVTTLLILTTLFGILPPQLKPA